MYKLNKDEIIMLQVAGLDPSNLIEHIDKHFKDSNLIMKRVKEYREVTLLIHICVKMNAEKALRKLEKFDEDFWQEESKKCRHLVVIDTLHLKSSN